MDFNLLFILPDKENENVLLLKADGKYQPPAYDKLVSVNVGFDEPQLYNDFFRNLTGVSVYRRYSFNTDNYVVFVFECADKQNLEPENGYCWVSYSDFLCSQQSHEIKNIINNTKCYYNKSINMPWVSIDGITPYFNWLYEVCSARNILINGEITQVKNAYVSNVYCIPTNMGSLYMKIPGKVFITELPFTYELKKIGMADNPVWVDFNSNMNVFLMHDMGGIDLPDKSDIETLKKVMVKLARTQKESIQHLPLGCEHNDYKIDTVLSDLSDFPGRVFDILSQTKYRITHDEKQKLESNIESAIKLLEVVKSKSIPDVIQNGDVRPGNIRVIDNEYIFYDWAWGAVSHPFHEPIAFLHIIRRNLLADIPSKNILVETYLNEWLEYGTQDELKTVFTILDDLKDLFWAHADYIWVKDIYSASNEPIELMSADGWLLERRIYYFESVLRRFIERDF